jgi:hypothetical protein
MPEDRAILPSLESRSGYFLGLRASNPCSNQNSAHSDWLRQGLGSRFPSLQSCPAEIRKVSHSGCSQESCSDLSWKASSYYPA